MPHTDYNLNDYVYVRLTEYGRKVYRFQYEVGNQNSPELQTVLFDGEEWQRFSLEDLFSNFGGPYAITATLQPFFGNHIKFPESEHFVVAPRRKKLLYAIKAPEPKETLEARLDLLMQDPLE